MASRPLDLETQLTACDREPIHIPGAIQPHGLLLVADRATRRIVAGAGALEERLAPDWHGRALDDLLRQDVGRLIATVAPGPGGAIAGAALDLDGVRHAVAVHITGDWLVAEIEPTSAEPLAAGELLAWLDATTTSFERAGDLRVLAERAAAAFRTLTGFDRVMIYRFLDDEAGSVLAEDRDPALDTFLHHRFPASDIPRQARALYVRNRARAIPDVDYVPAPLRPAGFEGLDLSDVSLRSVSPIHVQYLRNMGVGASASISIVKDGLLWGLIACHHQSPRRMPPDVRAAAAILASSLSRQIRAREEADSYRERLRLRVAEDEIVPRLAGSSLSRALIDTADDLRAMLDADGFAFVSRRSVETIGHVPDQEAIRDLAALAHDQASRDPLATHELGVLHPAARDWQSAASGLLALALPEEQVALLWFRAEQVEEVEWAGNPHKAAGAAPDGTLTPRASFASWSETVRGRARRWTLEQVEAAQRLRRVLRDAIQTRRLGELNTRLEKTLGDRDRLIAQQDVLIKEVNHRVQNSIQLVSSFLGLQARASGDADVQRHFAEAQARLAAVSLVHRRLYRDEQVHSVDLARYVDELVGDMRTSLGAEWAGMVRLDLAPVLTETDRAINVGLILTELIINATKYAYGGAPGPIAITLEQHRNRLRLIVADDGRGKAGGNQGFGSRMMDAMVSRLDGTIDYTDNAPGLRVILTAPVNEAR